MARRLQVVGSKLQPFHPFKRFSAQHPTRLLPIHLKNLEKEERHIEDCNPLQLQDVGLVPHLFDTMMLCNNWDTIPILKSIPRDRSHQIHFLYKRIRETSVDLSLIKNEHESIAMQYQECLEMEEQIQLMQNQGRSSRQSSMIGKEVCQRKGIMEKIINGKMAFISQCFLSFTNKLRETLTLLENVQSQVLLDDLLCWKREQQLQGNGAELSHDLNKIQEWCERLAEIVWSSRQQIIQAATVHNKLGCTIPDVTEVLPNLEKRSTELLSSLITSTFIIEKQPQQVIRTNTRITSTVRLLVGAKLNIPANPPKVSVSIINESQARAILKNRRKLGNETSGDILNNCGVMEYDESAGTLSAFFKNLRLKKIRRSEKKGSECVTDEKFSLFFQSQFPVGDGELVFQVWTLSLPVVVVVHGSQDPHAWATVTWDNAFAKPGRIPFHVPDEMNWEQISEALRMKFKSVTGCSLTDRNIDFLAEKIFGFPASDYGSMVINFSQLCTELLPQRAFSFWEWFYGVMKLTREHLRDLWLDGHILGFVRKKDAEDLLFSCAKGTFLLRFSDSELGGITIAWVGENNEVLMLQPFTNKDFAVRSLADRISDLQQLIYLYLQVPKDLAFGKYYTPFDGNPPINGYVKPLLVTYVPGVGGGSTLRLPSTSQLCSYLHDSSLLGDSSSGFAGMLSSEIIHRTVVE